MDNIKLATGGDDLKIWDTSNFSLHHYFAPHSGPIRDLSWSYNNQFLASASASGDKINLTYVKNSFQNAETAIEAEQTAVKFSNITNRFLLTGGNNGEVNVWDLKTQQLKKAYLGHTAPIKRVQFNWNDSLIASSNSEGDIIIHNAASGQGCSPLRSSQSQAVCDLRFSGLQKSLLGSVSDDGAVNLWDTSAHRQVHHFQEKHMAPAVGLAFSPVNVMLLTTVGYDKRIIFHDVQNKVYIKTIIHDDPLTAVDFFHDGIILAVGTMRGKLAMYDLRHTSVPIHTVVASNQAVEYLTFQSHRSNMTSEGCLISKRSPSRSNTGSPKRFNAPLSPRSINTNNSNSIKTEKNSVHIPVVHRLLGNDGNFRNCVPSHSADQLITHTSVQHYSSTSESITIPSSFQSDLTLSPSTDNSGVMEMTPVRKQPIGAGSNSEGGLSSRLGDRPITTGLSEADMISNGAANGSLFLSTDDAGKDHYNINLPLPPAFVSETSDLDHQVMAVEAAPSSASLPVMSASAACRIAPSTSSRQNLQMDYIHHIVNDAVKPLRDDINQIRDHVAETQDRIREDLRQMHFDIYKNFQEHQMEMEAFVKSQFAENQALVAEIERLREENKKLKMKY